MSPPTSLKLESELDAHRAANSAKEEGAYQDGSDSNFFMPQHRACSLEQGFLVLGHILELRSYIEKIEMKYYNNEMHGVKKSQVKWTTSISVQQSSALELGENDFIASSMGR